MSEQAGTFNKMSKLGGSYQKYGNIPKVTTAQSSIWGISPPGGGITPWLQGSVPLLTK